MALVFPLDQQLPDSWRCYKKSISYLNYSILPTLTRSEHQDALGSCICFLVFQRTIKQDIWADAPTQTILEPRLGNAEQRWNCMLSSQSRGLLRNPIFWFGKPCSWKQTKKNLQYSLDHSKSNCYKLIQTVAFLKYIPRISVSVVSQGGNSRWAGWPCFPRHNKKRKKTLQHQKDH